MFDGWCWNSNDVEKVELSCLKWVFNRVSRVVCLQFRYMMVVVCFVTWMVALYLHLKVCSPVRPFFPPFPYQVISQFPVFSLKTVGSGGGEEEVMWEWDWHITGGLTQVLHTDSVVRKARQRLFHLRCLRKFWVSSQIMRNLYFCTIESILMGNVMAWYRNSTKQDCKALRRVVCSAEHQTRS